MLNHVMFMHKHCGLCTTEWDWVMWHTVAI